MKYTAAHWGVYQFDPGDADLRPVADDPMPSRAGRGWVSAVTNRAARIVAPAVRRGWLTKDTGAGRCADSFVEISWDQATELVADEISRVRARYGNQAIFGGSYGWSSAGRFHHAQGQMRRLLAASGGYTSSRGTYSHAAAETLFPHIFGISLRDYQDQMTSLPLVAEHCEFLLAFGGISTRTAQISSSGTSTHMIGAWLAKLDEAGVRVLSIGPEKGEAREWLPIRPGTDTALILSLIHWITDAGHEDQAFLKHCTSGWNTLKAYIMGQADGVAKSPAWAAAICDIPVSTIEDLAATLVGKRSMITMTWGMQRADHGEQSIWSGLALAAVLGQIGQPGTGFGFGYGSVAAVGRAVRWIPWPSLPKAQNAIDDWIPTARIADALLHPGELYAYNGETRFYPDLKLVWWSGGNPYHHHQDLFRLEKAWTRPETVIVSEHSWTATARRADIVLPATTPLERDDLMLNRRDPTLVYMSRFCSPIGQARDDFDFCADIAERLGVRREFTEDRSTDAWLRHLWSGAIEVARANGIELPDFESFRGSGRYTIPEPDKNRTLFENFVSDPTGSPLSTESGRITLSNKTISQMGYADCPGHPTWLPPAEGESLPDSAFHLISGQPTTRLHGQNDQGEAARSAKKYGREVCLLHSLAADQIGIDDGEILRLYNERGACLCAARVSDDIRPDCLSLPTGAWFDPQVIEGVPTDVHGNPNVLTMDKGCSSLSQGCIAHSCVVFAEKWKKPLPELRVTKPPEIDGSYQSRK